SRRHGGAADQRPAPTPHPRGTARVPRPRRGPLRSGRQAGAGEHPVLSGQGGSPRVGPVTLPRLDSTTVRDETEVSLDVSSGRGNELLELFGLTAAADRQIHTYSGGMQRRLDIATALFDAPPVLFLDEPTTGLNPQSRRALWAEIRELQSRGTTLFLTTQYLEEADQLADRIVVLDAGTIVAEGTPADLKHLHG